MTTAAQNRIAPYLSGPQKTLPPLPATAEGRSALLADAVFAAVAALQRLLTHADPNVVMRAAEMILDFEKTRLRHGRPVAGTVPTSPLAPLPTLDPLPATSPADAAAEGPPSLEQAVHAGRILFDALDSNDTLDDPQPELDPARVEQVRRRLQKIADGRGDGEVVTREKAEAVYRYIVENDIRPDSFPDQMPPSPARPQLPA